MAWVNLEQLIHYLDGTLAALGMTPANRESVIDVFMFNTKRQMGHHDIYDLEGQLRAVIAGKICVNPDIRRLASGGCQERWDGGNGMGAIACTHAMKRAIELAKEYGMGLCAMRNTNHYVTSASYTAMAAEAGCIGVIIAKAGPSMGVPGYAQTIISQSPNGYAFATNHEWNTSMDCSLAYVAHHGNLEKAIAAGEKIPWWWGVDAEGNPTDDPAALLHGTHYPIGGYKGYGYAILCELLTGVLSGSTVLDQTADEAGCESVTSHTAIAIKADALMDYDTFLSRATELVDRISARAPGIRIPGENSGKMQHKTEREGGLELSGDLIERLNKLAQTCGAAVVL